MSDDKIRVSIADVSHHNYTLQNAPRGAEHVLLIAIALSKGATVPPIVVHPNPDGTTLWRISNGNHRILAHKIMGMDRVDAILVANEWVTT